MALECIFRPQPRGGRDTLPPDDAVATVDVIPSIQDYVAGRVEADGLPFGPGHRR
jgi:hypothetical protein